MMTGTASTRTDERAVSNPSERLITALPDAGPAHGGGPDSGRRWGAPGNHNRAAEPPLERVSEARNSRCPCGFAAGE